MRNKNIILTAYFDRKKRYRLFLKVFKKSIITTMPETKIIVLKMDLPPNIDHKRDTAFAFLAAAEYVLKCNMPMAIADVDLMFIGDISEVWKYDFDIAVTVRKSPKYNTGLWFYRPTKNSKLFIKRWINETKKLMKSFKKDFPFIWSHGGLDQASLFLVAKKNDYAKIKELPCVEWNACQADWMNIDKKTKVIHVKSKLRLAAFKKIEIPEHLNYLKPLVKKWRSYL